MVRVAHTERHPARTRAVLLGEVRGVAAGLVVDDEVDPALAEQGDVLGPVAGDDDEPEPFEHLLELAARRRGELDELEAVEAERVVEQVAHGRLSAR